MNAALLTFESMDSCLVMDDHGVSSPGASTDNDSTTSERPKHNSSFTPAPLSVTVAFRYGRILFVTLAVFGIIFAVMQSLVNGIELRRFDTREVDIDERGRLLDDYNSYSAYVSTAFGKPIEFVAALLVQVIFLSVFSGHYTTIDFSWKLGLAKLLVSSLVTYSVTNGFNALNVQLQFEDPSLAIVSSDLFVAWYANTSMSDFETNVTYSTPEQAPRNSITNTALRNAVMPRMVFKPDFCNFEQTRATPARPRPIPVPSVDYGFSQRDWQARFLQEAPKPKTLRYIVNATDKAANDDFKNASWPVDIPLASILLKYMTAVAHHYVPWGGHDSVFVNISDPSVNATEAEQREWFTNWFPRVVTRMFNSSNRTSRRDIVVEFSHVDISPTIGFDALTLEVELDPALLATSERADKQARYTQVTQAQAPSGFSPNCGPWPALCLVKKPTYRPPTAYHTDAVQQVLAFGSCLHPKGYEDLVRRPDQEYFCQNISMYSMMVMSVGRRLVADSLQQNVSANGTSRGVGKPALITNLRKIYTVTMGRLSWKMEDLSVLFNATCELTIDAKCWGLQIPLSTRSLRMENWGAEMNLQRLVLTAVGLPTGMMLPSPRLHSLGPRAVPLVTITEPQDDDILTGDVLLRHNIRNISWQQQINLNGSCDADVEALLFTKTSNHLYIEHGLQTAYTAATFFLFQNAAVKDQVWISRQRNISTLVFFGNRQEVVVRASTPWQSAMMTTVGGMVLVFVIAFAMIYAYLGKCRLQSISVPQAIARVALDGALFPSFVLARHVVEDDPAHERRDLDVFTITELMMEEDDTCDQLIARTEDTKDDQI